MIGGGVGILLMFYSGYCAKSQILNYPGDMYASLKCPWLYTDGPGLLLSIVLYHAPGINLLLKDVSNSLMFENILIVMGWTLVGIVGGIFLKFLRSKLVGSLDGS